jgi:hypothetical protein
MPNEVVTSNPVDGQEVVTETSAVITWMADGSAGH